MIKLFLLLLCIFGQISGQDPNYKPDVPVTDFLAKIMSAIVEKRGADVAALFLDGFKFVGCRAEYDRETVIEKLMTIQNPSQLQIHQNHSDWIHYNSDLIFTVTISGFDGYDTFQGEFILACDWIGSGWRLTSGRRPSCDQRQRFGGNSNFVSKQVDATTVVRAFLKFLDGLVKARKMEWIRDMFLETFRFYGCKGNYDKDQTIKRLLEVPSNSQVSFNVLSATFTDEDEGIEYTVVVSGIAPADLTMVFHLYKERFAGNHWRLSSGVLKGCPGRRSFSNLMLGKSYGFVQSILDRVTEGIQAKDSGKLHGVLQTNFIFQGCRGNYDEEATIELLTSFPMGTVISFKINRIQMDTAKALYLAKVEMTGFGASRIRMEIVSNILTRKLVFGKIMDCGRNLM